MRHRLLATAALAALLTCAACQSGAVSNVPVTKKGGPAATQQTGAVLTGRVMVPAGIIAAGGGNLIGHAGGNIIAAGGGNYRTLAGEALEEAPLADGEVFLADAAGEPLPGYKPVKPNAEGRYTIPDVKAGYTFVVVAKAKDKAGKDVMFQTIAKATELGATADMDAATTLVTAGLVAEADGSLANFNAFKFKTAADATKKSLRRDNLPDFGDRAALLATIRALSAEVAEIRTALEEVKQELAQVKAQLADLQSQLEQVMAGGAQQGPVDCGQFIGRLDADGSGGVTLDEWEKGFHPGQASPKEIFIFIDRDADGVITSAEFVPTCEARQSQPGGPPPGSCEDGFRLLDQDRSGAIDLDEFKRNHRPPPGANPPPVEQLFQGFDRDGDGSLSEQEFVDACKLREQGPPPGP